MSVRHTLLALLSEGPKYGLQLSEELGARTGDGRQLTVGQLYAALGRLERDGLVESAGTGAPGPHKKFQITAGGEGELAAWLRTPARPVSAPPGQLVSAPHGQMAAKVLAALQVPGTDVHEIVQVHRRSLIELLQQQTRIKQEKAGDDLALGLRIDAELLRLGSVIRWLDAADARLMNAAGGLPPPAPPALPPPRGGTEASPGWAPHRDRSRAAAARIRVSDLDRERATARLGEAFAEGRLTRAELDERITAALNAQTAGDLWHVTADLP